MSKGRSRSKSIIEQHTGIIDGVMVAGPKNQPLLMPPAPQRAVTLIKDHKLEYPALLWNVFIPDEHVKPEFAEMFVRSGCQWANSMATADLVVFTGGPDVNPKLYGAKKHNETHFDVKRDDRDIKLYADALKMGIPMFGVCRGAQFLHVMQGGMLYQHIDGHVGKHPIRDVMMHDTINSVSSTHHQACIEHPQPKKMVILATAWEAKTKWLDNKECHIHHAQDIEAFWYPDTCCLGVQGHPEFANYSKYTQWCLNQLEFFIANNPHVKVDESQHYRHRKTVVLGAEDDLSTTY